MFGLTNIIIIIIIITIFGGGKDGAFNREMSELLGTTRITRTTYTHGAARMSTGTSHAATDEPVLRPEEIRLLPERHALVVPENAKPLIVRGHPRHRRQTRPSPTGRTRGRQSPSRSCPRPATPSGCAHPSRHRRGHPPGPDRTTRADTTTPS